MKRWMRRSSASSASSSDGPVMALSASISSLASRRSDEARDAVHAPLDGETLAAGITALGRNVVRVETPATRRDVYLRRPDLGRRLKAESAECLDKLQRDGFDIAIVVADGLSSRVVTNNAVPLLSRLIPKARGCGFDARPCRCCRRGARSTRRRDRRAARCAAGSRSDRRAPWPVLPRQPRRLSYLRPSSWTDGCGTELRFEHSRWRARC
jgi:hypothetical protein